VTYPLVERPLFEVDGATYQVVQCSERGLRYEVSDGGIPAIGDKVRGTVRFRRGSSVQVTGEVSRAQAGEVVLILHQRGIPFSDMLLEQQYLRSKGYTLIN
jgi:hypothetical protein